MSGSTGIGYENPISGSGGLNFYYPKQFGLGGGIPGFIPQPVYTTNNDNEFIDTRFTLKNAWNTNYARAVNNNKSICTPFRAINNAGDLLSRKYYTCGGPCQTFQSRPGMFGLKQHFGSIQNQCDQTR